jgi:hypothetical protein
MILLSLTPDEIAFASRKGVGNLRIVRWACSPRRRGDRKVISCAAMRLADIRQPCEDSRKHRLQPARHGARSPSSNGALSVRQTRWLLLALR